MKGICEEKLTIKTESNALLSLNAKNGDSSLISETMEKEEEMLMKERVKKEDTEAVVPQEAPHLNDSQFTKLDELLTQTQLYSEFLLEKMDSITTVTSCLHFLMYLFSFLLKN